MRQSLPDKKLGHHLQSAKITDAVRRVYHDAGLNLISISTGIVPLYNLIEAYPIRCAEISNLTYQSADEFLKRETGGQAMPIARGKGKLAGFLYVYEYRGCFYGCILVEADGPVARRRFSAAHELGHYVLHFLPLLEQRTTETSSEAVVLVEGLNYEADIETEGKIPSGQLKFPGESGVKKHPIKTNDKQMEREANRFAAELLMPTSTCQFLIEDYSKRFSVKPRVLARRLAPEFLVSPEAMEWRIRSLTEGDVCEPIV
jgi:IrrE N-terminal-like domain